MAARWKGVLPPVEAELTLAPAASKAMHTHPRANRGQGAWTQSAPTPVPYRYLRGNGGYLGAVFARLCLSEHDRFACAFAVNTTGTLFARRIHSRQLHCVAWYNPFLCSVPHLLDTHTSTCTHCPLSCADGVLGPSTGTCVRTTLEVAGTLEAALTSAGVSHHHAPLRAHGGS